MCVAAAQWQHNGGRVRGLAVGESDRHVCVGPGRP